MKKFLALLMAAIMILSLAACGNNDTPTDPVEPNPGPATDPGSVPENPPEDPMDTLPIAELKTLNGKTYGTDYIDLYTQFGKDITIDQVIEDEETGTAYIERDGVLYTLGLDFLTCAMVHNTSVPDGGRWETEDDVYATWWRYYITRWNQLLPEIPLYANEYYDLYSAQIKGVQEHPTNPYWDPTSALIDWTSEKADNSIIVGSVTEMSGKVRYPAFAQAGSVNATDQDVQQLIVGLELVSLTKDGGYTWNDTVVAKHEEIDNDDGSRTYDITIHQDLKLSDGTPVTSKNYLAYVLAHSTPVAAQASGKTAQAGLQMVGYREFNVYDGANEGQEMPNPIDPDDEKVTAAKIFPGLRMYDDYHFSVTIDAEYLPYFYSVTYLALNAHDVKLWLGDSDIVDDGEGCYISGNFYAKDGDSYVMAKHIYDAAWNKDDAYAYSGAYVVETWNEADHSIVLKRNPEFKGNYEGTKPQIERVIIKLVVSETQLEDLKAGGVDVLSGITGGDETNEVIALADDPAQVDSNGNPKFAYTHYSRAGYGKLGFRCDFGPVQFAEVREAIAYCMDRAGFAKDFTGGFGGVVDGPYYAGSWMYKAAIADGMILNAYATSVDSAIAKLEEGGWVYNADGSEYSGSGVRYKAIPDAEMQEADKTFQSKDGAYKTVQVGDTWYMPLCLNWYGTTPNPFSDQLMTGFVENENMKNAGFVIQYTLGDFNPMLDELYQAQVYGYYGGTPLYTCFNYATGFPNTVYDYEYQLTINPARYDDWSQYYIKDMADAYWLK